MERSLHACVCALIRQSWNVPGDEKLSVGQLQRLGGSARSRVWRVTAARGRDGERSKDFIVKAPESVDNEQTDRQGRLGNEWAALSVLEARLGAERSRSMSPRLLAADLDVGVLLLEDLSPLRGCLDDLLTAKIKVQGGLATSILKLAHVLAQIHGRCHVRCADYLEVRSSCGLPLKPPPDPVKSVSALGILAESILGTEMERDRSAFEAEMQRAFLSSFSQEGDFATLIHGDLCPTNCAILNKVGDVAVLDFEFARLGNALMDASIFRLGFPTSPCSGQLPRALVRAAENLYRSEAARLGMVGVADREKWRRAMAECVALWTWGFLRSSFEKGVMEKDISMGRKVTCTRRQMIVVRLKTCIKSLEKHPDMQASLKVSKKILQVIVERWGIQEESETLFGKAQPQ